MPASRPSARQPVRPSAAPSASPSGLSARGQSFGRDVSASAVVAGVIAVVVSYGGPAALIFQAAAAAGLDQAHLSSWIWSISIGSGLAGLGLSLYYRQPVIIAWSTPGVALLVGSIAAYPYPEVIGAYIFSGLAIALLGVTGLFSTLMERIPRPVVAAMLAGILLRFGMDVFTQLSQAWALVWPMLACYLLAKRLAPRYAVLLTLLTGFAAAALLGLLHLGQVRAELTWPVLTAPAFSLKALIGLGAPLFLVTMTGQNATGLGVMRASGFDAPGGPLVAVTGALSAALAVFGCHGVNLAAITAAICTGPEAHPKPEKRYVAGVVCALAYLAVGAFGATLVALFTALPKPLIAVVSGLALFGAIISGLTQAMEDASRREAALVTFLVTASGISVFGIGAAFWGLLLGVGADYALCGAWAQRLRRAAGA